MDKARKITIIPTKWGMASRVKDKIYINEKIEKNSQLYNQLIKHELEHSSGYKFKDIFMDLYGKHLDNIKKDYYSFMLSNPRTWVMFLPIFKYESDWTIDITMILFWIIVLITIGVFII